MPQNERKPTSDKAIEVPVRKRKSRTDATSDVVKPLPTADERQRIRDRAAASDG